MEIPEMPITEAQLDTSKPTQTDFDIACRVLWWLAAHARLFPDEYGSEMGISQRPVDVFVAAANACDVDITMVVTTSAEQMERDAYNKHISAE
jgi:hypothetical protein